MQITNSNVCIEVKNVSFRYDGNLILENINFSVNTGEYLGVIGPNGGGKTTLLKIILGLLKPTTGTVKIFGDDVRNSKILLQIGYVPQRITQGDFHFPATVEEIVASGRTARRGLLKWLNQEDRTAIEKAMETAEITEHRNRSMSKLSGGEQQKVFIARALAGEPKILILDEPVVSVDNPSQEKFYTFLQEINQKFGLTIIFVSHDIDVVAHQVKSVLCLNHKLVCYGSPKEFIKEENMEKLYGKKVKFILHGR